MRPSRRPIIIAARQSPLARAQAHAVGLTLHRLNPRVEVDYRWVTSEADQHPNASLADIGGKGLFTGKVEQAVLNEQADIAVHSLKDLPADDAHTGIAQGLTLAAIPRRGDVRDCLIAREADSIESLPPGAILGTSSPRRAAQALRIRPDLVIQPLRGNVQTRINKVIEEGQFTATMLAAAGLHRAGLTQHAQRQIDPSAILPAACQGALAIQCRADDAVTLKRCLPLNDSVSAAAVNVERQVVRAMQGNCHSAIAVLAEPMNGPAAFRIRARVLSPDGQTCLEADEQSPASMLPRSVQRLIQHLLDAGGRQVLSGQPHH